MTRLDFTSIPVPGRIEMDDDCSTNIAGADEESMFDKITGSNRSTLMSGSSDGRNFTDGKRASHNSGLKTAREFGGKFGGDLPISTARELEASTTTGDNMSTIIDDAKTDASL